MRIAKKHIASALGVDGDETSQNLAIALRNLESILDDVAASLEDDHKADALGDASNLVQLLREGLGNG